MIAKSRLNSKHLIALINLTAALIILHTLKRHAEIKSTLWLPASSEPHNNFNSLLDAMRLLTLNLPAKSQIIRKSVIRIIPSVHTQLYDLSARTMNQFLAISRWGKLPRAIPIKSAASRAAHTRE
jgi:hypothetical protein